MKNIPTKKKPQRRLNKKRKYKSSEKAWFKTFRKALKAS